MSPSGRAPAEECGGIRSISVACAGALAILLVVPAFVSPAEAARNPPPPPALLHGFVVEDRIVLLAWAPPVEKGVMPFLSYRVYRAIGDGPSVLIGETHLTFFVDVVAAGNAVVTYAIRSVDMHGTESDSANYDNNPNGGGGECVRASSNGASVSTECLSN